MTRATHRAVHQVRRIVGVLSYGAVFAVGLPLALWAWVDRLDQWLVLPIYGSPLAGLVVAGVGVVLMAAAMRALWQFGKGLPMSPFPPEQFVTRGVYGIVADPIYIGAVVTCLGAALTARSAGGLWIVTPVLALAALAFVWGFERPKTVRRFGPLPSPWLRIPGDGDGPPDVRDRVSVLVLVFAPWLVLFSAVSLLGVSQTAWPTYLTWDRQLAVIPWTEGVYAAAYVLVLLAPFVARRQRDLRQFALRGLGATAGILAFYLLVPLVAPAKPVPDGTSWNWLMQMERAFDQRACSLPAFHVVWACIAAAAWVAGRPRWRPVAAAACLAIGISCVTAGMHAALDVVAGFAAYGLVVRAPRIWDWMCRQSERVANSWREWQAGPVRFINHGVYAAVGGAAGVGIAVWFAGMHELWSITGLALGGQAGAALWAQLIEGSPQLLRPYGYFGSVVAVIVLAAAAGATGHDPWLLLGAMAVGGCVTQILGRIRCLVQGCCHGRPVDAPWGIRHTHPRSRVARLSTLGGQRLHPTALYSMVWTACVFGALVRLWLLGVPLTFISGSYLLLVGLGRFVEEHFRGEPQTAEIGGLRLYQWLAIVFVVVGCALTALGGSPAPWPRTPDFSLWPVLAAVLVVTYVAYGVDLPRSNRPFSRLV